MAKFQVKSVKRGKVTLTEPGTLGAAQPAADKLLKAGEHSVITILRDSEGDDHPDNAGKFFLYRIVKSPTTIPPSGPPCAGFLLCDCPIPAAMASCRSDHRPRAAMANCRSDHRPGPPWPRLRTLTFLV